MPGGRPSREDNIVVLASVKAALAPLGGSAGLDPGSARRSRISVGDGRTGLRRGLRTPGLLTTCFCGPGEGKQSIVITVEITVQGLGYEVSPKSTTLLISQEGRAGLDDGAS